MQLIAFYPTDDLLATRAFYGDVMGLCVYKDQGTCVIYQINENALIGFCAHKRVPDRPEELYITFVTEDVDAMYEALIQNGAETVKAPAANARFDVYQALLRDPNGYTIEIQRFLH